MSPSLTEIHCFVPQKEPELTRAGGTKKPPVIRTQIGATCAALFQGSPCHLFLESYTNYLKSSS